MHRSIPDVPKMADPGLYEFLSAMRRSLYHVASMVEEGTDAHGTRISVVFGRDAREFVTYNRITEKFEFYQGGALVYSIPP